jgi:RNA polymerase sigma factor (TIGR02999 family)
MRRERAGQTLQPTALVNEVYLRLADLGHVHLRDRAHFFALSARLMRRILVDIARAKGNQKRGGAVRKVSLDEGLVVSAEPDADLVAVDEALAVFATVDPRELARAIERLTSGGSRASVGNNRGAPDAPLELARTASRENAMSRL